MSIYVGPSHATCIVQPCDPSSTLLAMYNMYERGNNDTLLSSKLHNP